MQYVMDVFTIEFLHPLYQCVGNCCTVKECLSKVTIYSHINLLGLHPSRNALTGTSSWHPVSLCCHSNNDNKHLHHFLGLYPSKSALSSEEKQFQTPGNMERLSLIIKKTLNLKKQTCHSSSGTLQSF